MQAPIATEGGLDGRDPQVRPCPGCGAENLASSTFCWRCYRAFEGPMVQGARPLQQATWPLAPTPPVPLRQTRRGGSVGRVGAIVAVTLGVAATVAFVALRGPGTSFPDRLAGLERATDPQSEAAAASFRAASQAQGLDGEMAFFSEGGAPVAALAWIRGAEPSTGGATEAFDLFTEGFTSGYNGSVITSDRAEETVGDTTYVCAPVLGPVSAGVCMWQDDDVFWVLMDVRPGTTVQQTRALAVSAHDAAG